MTKDADQYYPRFPYKVGITSDISLHLLVEWIEKNIGCLHVDWTWQVSKDDNFNLILRFKTEHNANWAALVWT
jgi:hypothetical protein